MSDVFSLLINLQYGVRNLLRWVPIIWRDRDWDWAFLGTMMRHKLLWMAELEENHGHHVGSKRDAKRQRICAELLDRLIKDEYDERAMAAAGMDICGKFTTEPAGPHLRRIVFDDDGRSEERHQIYKRSRNMRKYEAEYLGKMLGKYMTGWWD